MSHRPRKRFGQHFLHDPMVIARIVEAIAPRREDRMVEIGPGLGAMTRPLLARLDRLDVVEIDRDLAAELPARCDHAAGLRLHLADALRFDFAALSPGLHGLRVVGNLPYNISTPLLFHLLDAIACIDDMHLMLQEEVVRRITASPGGKDYGRLSVMLQLHCESDYLLHVGPGAFRPPPAVDSAVLRLTPRRRPLAELTDSRAFATLVQRAFAQRRKTLRNNLRGWAQDEDMESAGIDPVARAETLSVQAFARLANRLADTGRATEPPTAP